MRGARSGQPHEAHTDAVRGMSRTDIVALEHEVNQPTVGKMIDREYIP